SRPCVAIAYSSGWFHVIQSMSEFKSAAPSVPTSSSSFGQWFGGIQPPGPIPIDDCLGGSGRGSQSSGSHGSPPFGKSGRTQPPGAIPMDEGPPSNRAPLSSGTF